MRTRVFDAHHRYLSEEIWSCGQDLFETPVASIQSGEHLHFEDRDEVGWLGPSRSLRMMKKSEREERSGTRDVNFANLPDQRFTGKNHW